MRAITAIALITGWIISMSAAQTADAQIQWNRKVEATAIVPTGASPDEHQLQVVWKVLLDEVQSVPIDLSTSVVVHVNGIPIAEQLVQIGIEPGTGFCIDGGSCAGGCGSGYIDGVFNTLVCQADGPCQAGCDCFCGFLPITTPFDPTPLRPGDEIMVLLRPAPGALPEQDPSDDRFDLTFGGEPSFWNRSIQSLTLSPTPGAPPDLFDIEVETLIQFDGMAPFVNSAGLLHLDFALDLLVNETRVETMMMSWSPGSLGPNCSSQPCGGGCAIVGNESLGCQAWYPMPWSPCSCGGAAFAYFGPVPLEPGDVIVVILRPVPGALPELPGFPDDDEKRAECCPTAGIGEQESAARAGWALQQNEPNPFNPSTSIGFSLEEAGHVSLEVYDLRGGLVRTLADDAHYGSGAWSLQWDGSANTGQRVSSGIYFYRLTVEGRSETRKMTILK